MARVVLDATSVLALLKKERGTGVFTDALLAFAAISSINLAEVQTVLVREGIPPEHARKDATSPVMTVEPFTAEQARIAGNLVAQTKSLGLSLADRACLALAITLNAPVYTADKAWKKLKVPCPVHIIR